MVAKHSWKWTTIALTFIALLIFYFYFLTPYLTERALNQSDSFYDDLIRKDEMGQTFTGLFPDNTWTLDAYDESLRVESPAKNDYGKLQLGIKLNFLTLKPAGEYYLTCFTERQGFKQWKMKKSELLQFLKNNFSTNEKCKQ